jgi:subtilase family serine protease
MRKKFLMTKTFTAMAVLAFAVSILPQTIQAQDAEPATETQIAASQLPVPSRVVQHVDDARLSRLTGNTHPLAQKQFDKGLVDPDKLLARMVLVLKRSPEQEAALAAFNERQYQPGSADFHHWLHADEFGKLYGPNDSDIGEITSWLQNHGFEIGTIGKGRVWIEFSGNVKQVQDAFHVEMHHYLVDGKMHIANDRDPEIPDALSPVIIGIASLNNFAPTHYSHPGAYVRRDLKTGKYTVLPPAIPIEGVHAEAAGSEGKAGFGSEATGQSSSGVVKSGVVKPEFGYTDASTGYQREELSPYDVATIYNILPLWNASTPINGKGVKVAIVALSDVVTSDFNTYRSSFGLPAGTLTTVHSGADPGLTDSQGENTEDTEMVSATAPGATVVLVADPSSDTTNGLVTAVNYIVDNEIAPILTMSYGACELKLGTSGNALYNQTFQQAATAGISSFVASGDSGSAVCTPQNGTPPYGDQYGLAVSGMASTPYVTAVGGTDLQWPLVETTHAPSTYWNSSNDAHGASAKGYMPEMSWNDTCANPLLLNVFTGYTSNESLCNDAINGDPGLVEMAAGSGGVSKCTTNSTTDISTSFNPASCSGGYAKPSWQAGVTGIPADGKRDLPDVSMFAAYGFQQSTGLPGSALLICQASASTENSCDYSNPSYITYQENGGTSAASPMTAGVMALVLQKTGAKQGLANPVFYSLAAKENYSACNSNTVAAGNSCIFYDTTSGSNAAVCYTGDTNCVTKTSGDTAGILSGYSATAGYDLTTGLGSFNVANLVNAWPTTTTTTHTLSLSPTSLAFGTVTVGTTTAAEVVTVKNTGNSALTLTSETVSAPFLKSATTCGTSLAVGASCTVSVEYKPTAASASTGTLVVASNGTSTPASVALTGTGKAATTLTLSLSPTSLAFGTAKVGTTTAAQVVTIKNTSTGAITLTSETVSSPFFKSATTCGTSLAAAATCTVSVECKPTAAGASTGTLVVASNGTSSPASVALTGTGATYTLSLAPTSLAFGTVTVGTTTAAQLVTVKNTGNTALSLTSETVSAPFVKSATTCGTSLAVAASCTVSVEYKPTSAVASTGTLVVASNGTSAPASVALTGTGKTTASTLALSPASLAFGSVKVGTTSATQVVTIKNTTSGVVTLTSETVSAPFVKTASNCGPSIGNGSYCTVTIAYKPTAAGASNGTLVVVSNGTGSPNSIALTGTGTTTASTLALSPTSLAFGSVKAGTTSATQVVTIKNTTSGVVTLTSETVSAPFVKTASNCGPSIGNGSYCTVTIAYKPTATGTSNGTLVVVSNGTGSPNSIALTGTGTGTASTLALSPTSLSFGTVKVGATSATQVVTIKNTTSGVVTLTSETVSAPFVKTASNCGPSIGNGSYCTVTIAYKPTATGTSNGTLVVVSNGVGSPNSITMTGTGD